MARPDFDPSDAIDFWDLTNRQDWHVNELTQLGFEVPRLSPARTPTRKDCSAPSIAITCA